MSAPQPTGTREAAEREVAHAPAGRPRYDERTALVVVDVQNDFADPDGSLAVAHAGEILPRIAEEMAAAQAAGATVVRTQDWHPPVTPHFAKDGGVWPVHCVQDTWGAAFHPELPDAGDVVRKGSGPYDGYSGFTVRLPDTGEERPTELRATLEERGITRVVVVGLATDYCVLETALDAARHGFHTTVLRDAVRAVDRQPGDGEAALATMADAGVDVV